MGRWGSIGLRCRSQSVGFTTGTRPVGVWSNRTNGNSYADDFVIFTKTEAAAQRVYGSIERFLTDRLKLTVNHDKSNIRKTDGLEYVGYEFRGYGGQIRVSGKKLKAFKERASEIFRRNRGVSMESRYKAFASYERGWLGYFALDQMKTTFTNLDKCPKLINAGRRVRACYWKQWRKSKTRLKNLMSLGVSYRVARGFAMSGKGSCWLAGRASFHDVRCPVSFIQRVSGR
ncbi:group II intron maturase-specific domain-containing protein [Stieleria varia]|uniref:group II intron maturase-specific domain-containing protein n=1 Tax=Stieleria varia TaxID=2528005 RepID=UPI00313DBA4E